MYANPLVDSLIERGRSARDADERNALYGEAERRIVADAPWVHFWHRSDYMVRQPWLAPLRTSPVYTMDKGLDLSFTGRAGEGR
jgi:ABC-type transport system substrate-binding protein